MATVNDIYGYIDSYAPFGIRWSGDNVGILVGDAFNVCKKALISLDITSDTVIQAHSEGADLIISHHPVIFRPIKVLEENHPAYLLAHFGIAAICAHTNLDCASGGVNDILISLCGVYGNTAVLYDSENLPLGRIGILKRDYTVEEFSEFIRESLDTKCIRYSEPVSDVRKIAVIGGAGASEMSAAKAAGCDTLVTGEAKYNEFCDAVSLGINLIEAGHFATENPIVSELYDRLVSEFPEVEFIKADHKDPVNIL